MPAYTTRRLKVPWNITLNFLFLRVPEAGADGIGPVKKLKSMKTCGQPTRRHTPCPA